MKMVLCNLAAFAAILLSGTWVTLGTYAPARACSIEIWPIEDVVPSARLTIIATVDSVRTEVVYQDEDIGIITEPRWTDVQVERVLQGDLAPGLLRLFFSEGMYASWSTCAFLAEPYQKGNRLLLMVTEGEQDAPLAPTVPPRLIELGGEASALTSQVVAFIEYTIGNGVPPLHIEFPGPWHCSSDVQATLPVRLVNNLEAPVTVVADPQAGESEPGVAIWFALGSRDEGVKLSLRYVSGAPVSIAPGQDAELIVELTAEHALTGGYHCHLNSWVKLPAGEGASYIDLTSHHLPDILGDGAGVSAASWGSVKQSF